MLIFASGDYVIARKDKFQGDDREARGTKLSKIPGSTRHLALLGDKGYEI